MSPLTQGLRYRAACDHPEFFAPEYRCGYPAGHPKLLQLETPLFCGASCQKIAAERRRRYDVRRAVHYLVHSDRQWSAEVAFYQYNAVHGVCVNACLCLPRLSVNDIQHNVYIHRGKFQRRLHRIWNVSESPINCDGQGKRYCDGILVMIMMMIADVVVVVIRKNSLCSKISNTKTRSVEMAELCMVDHDHRDESSGAYAVAQP